MKKFVVNDEGFICKNCGYKVPPLGYSSRNHCPKCLCSLHIDVFPGDRNNTCLGMQHPIAIEENSKKGRVIVYSCEKCGAITRNVSATDDDFEEILKVAKNFANSKKY